MTRILPITRWPLWGLCLLLVGNCGEPGADVVDDASVVVDSSDGGPVDAGSEDAGPVDAGPTVDGGCKTNSDCPTPSGPCEVPRCESDGSCSTLSVCECADDADCATHEDGDPCNGTLFCDHKTAPWRCRINPASVVQCATDGDSWCRINACQETTGKCTLVPRNEGAPCEDGVLCTLGGQCKAGACTGQVDVCACQSDADCTAKGSEDKCAGVSVCDKAMLPWTCQVDVSKAVVCATNGDGPCATNTCDPSTGVCALAAAASGTTCDDGDACTTGDSCAGTACQPGADNTCVCDSNADCAAQEDGDVCNGTLYCNKSAKTPTCALNPATVVKCPTVGDTGCLKNTCFPGTGLCQPVAVEQLICQPAGAPDCTWSLKAPGAAVGNAVGCDDGDTCTKGEVCSGGSCAGGTDLCACNVDADCAAKEDGNQCNGTLFCNKQSGKCELDSGKTVTCPSAADTACTKNACVPATGKCVVTATGLAKAIPCAGKAEQTCRWEVKPAGEAETKGLPCDDGDKCTKSDVCAAGKCVSGTFICLCTTDKDCAAKDDGDLCNGTMYCDQATKICKLNEATKVSCPSVGDTFCAKNLCVPASGLCKMTPVHVNELCDDGDKCTKGDICQGGKCLPGTPWCECTKDADCAAKEDGDLCNGTLYCDKTGDMPACVVNKSTLITCNKKPPSACLAALCDPSSGKCQVGPGPDGGACDDGTLCTSSDACNKGQCLGKAVDCDDGNACSNDSCLAAKGCQHQFAVCDDGNSCTVDSCDATTGKCLANAAALNNKACDADSDPCTVGDACNWGVCKSGQILVCDLPAGACQQAVCQKIDSKNHKCLLVQQANGSVCDDGNPCTVGSSCTAGKCAGKGQDRYYSQFYVPPKTVGRFHGVAQRGADGLLLVGGTHDLPGGKAGGRVWWLAAVDAGGTLAWQKTVAGAKDHAEQQAWAVARTGGEHVVVAGSLTGSDGDADVHLKSYDQAGNLQWTKVFGSDVGHEVPRALLVEPDGGMIIAGDHTKGHRSLYALRIGANKQALWQLVYGAPKRDNRALAVVRQADGHLMMLGRNLDQESGVGGALALPVSGDGKAGKGRVIHAGQTWHFTAAIRGAAGRVLALGDSGTPAKSSSLVVGLDGQAGVSWKAGGSDNVRIAAAVATAKDRIAVVGTSTPTGGKSAVYAWGGDRFGNVQWSQNWSSGDGAESSGVADLGKLGLAISGARTYQGKTSGLLIRADPWGRASCKKTDKCLDKAAGHCDDGKHCTADRCDAAQACKHGAVDTLLCDAKDGCSLPGACKSGTCKSAVNGRLFSHSWQYDKGPSTHAQTIALTNGTYVTTGQTVDQGKHSAYVARFAADGSEVHRLSFTIDGQAWGAALAPMSDGGYVVLGRNSGKGRYGAIQRRSVDNKMLWGKSHEFFKSARPLGLLAFADGNFGVILQPLGGAANSVQVRKHNPAGGQIWLSAGMSTGQVTGGKPWRPDSSADTAKTGQTLISWRGSARSDGSSVIGGTLIDTTGSAKRRGWLAGLAGNGTKQWATAFAPSTSVHMYILDVAAGPGGAVAGGVRASNTNEGWILAVNGSGKQLWQQFYKGYGHAIDSVSVLATGEVVAGGWKTVNGETGAWLGRFTAGGTMQWQRILGTTKGFVHAIYALPDGDLLLGGSSQPSGSTLLMRADRWGHVGCAAAGNCAGKAANGCSDGNKCTVNYCDAAKGCQKTSLPPAQCSGIYK